MELDTKFRENPASQPVLLSDNYLKSYIKDDFSFEATNGSSSNPIFGVQTQYYDTLNNNFTYGCTSTDFDTEWTEVVKIGSKWI